MDTAASRAPMMAAGNQELAQVPARIRPDRREAHGGHPAEPDGEERDRHRGQPEVGQRQAEHADEPPHIVGRGVLLHRGQNTDRQRDQQRDDHRHHRQVAGQADPLHELLGHGPAARERAPEIALEDSAHPDPVLRQERAVEPQLLTRAGEHLRRRRRRLVELHQDGVPGKDAHEREDQDRHEPQHQDAHEQPACDVGPHARGPASSPAYCAYLSNFRAGALSVIQAVLASYEQ